MTWRTWMEKYLTDRGLWPQEAVEVVNRVAADNEPKSKIGPIGEIIDCSQAGYHRTFYVVIAELLNRKALDYIDKNKPKHFARPMFLSLAERDKLLSF